MVSPLKALPLRQTLDSAFCQCPVQGYVKEAGSGGKEKERKEGKEGLRGVEEEAWKIMGQGQARE